jgi:hypothetical protein
MIRFLCQALFLVLTDRFELSLTGPQPVVLTANTKSDLVGVAGFEPATSSSQN